jgi:hypothetical protein
MTYNFINILKQYLFIFLQKKNDVDRLYFIIMILQKKEKKKNYYIADYSFIFNEKQKDFFLSHS